MAKNRNQNPNRRSPQQDPQRSSSEAQEQGRSQQSEEHAMPGTTQVSRKHQQKRFGHN
ncbi:hypothetical protein [Streptomyces sp. NPDC021020]|uniref:hypothetical protein n=1 Tax=Streptomyces sp. NPDC021020 TaxID=3365109 RepID=UPI0037B629B5